MRVRWPIHVPNMPSREDPKGHRKFVSTRKLCTLTNETGTLYTFPRLCFTAVLFEECRRPARCTATFALGSRAKTGHGQLSVWNALLENIQAAAATPDCTPKDSLRRLAIPHFNLCIARVACQRPLERPGEGCAC
ncbi:hypothetical protein PsYK624_150230 [Phanerochaete sordida]|uniref:Uncharacterized protein n=1 Tax=Phanerochaete sordida TaxID=48140 RepID=A0A9P3LLY2_9APHY|nr:hypothetical protein PsYK624_150230 [Phanerochaete sordida]